MDSINNTRPQPTIPNSRFGDVRADEVRVRDIVEVGRFGPGRSRDGVVTQVQIVGDDVIVSGFCTDGGEFEFTTSEGNGVNVIGRA